MLKLRSYSTFWNKISKPWVDQALAGWNNSKKALTRETLAKLWYIVFQSSVAIYTGRILSIKKQELRQYRMRCLKIDDKWVNLILNGTKTWEIRRRNTRIRERIALGNKKIKRSVGYARIVDSVEMTVEELKKHKDKHQANDFLDKYAKGSETLFAWVLDDVEVEAKPKLYSHSTGSWCRILNENKLRNAGTGQITDFT